MRNRAQIYAIPLGGFTTRQATTASGSGSTFVQGFLDSQWRPNMTEADARKFVLEGWRSQFDDIFQQKKSINDFAAVALAMYRDGSSGGVCRLGILTKEGIKRELYTPDEDTIPKFTQPPTFTLKNCL